MALLLGTNTTGSDTTSATVPTTTTDLARYSVSGVVTLPSDWPLARKNINFTETPKANNSMIQAMTSPRS